MRRTTLLLFAVTIVHAQSPDNTGMMHGVVKDEATGLPLSGAFVQAGDRVEAEGMTRIPSEGGVWTDGQGRYAFTRLPGDTRELMVHYYGYITATRSVRVSAGQDLRVDFLVAATPTISGRVLDANRKPAQYASVWLIQSEYRSGVLSHRRIGLRTTGEDGSFTFDENLEAGRSYYLRAERPPQNKSGRIEAPTYYGESTSLEAAAPLILRPGEHRKQADISMRMADSHCVDGGVTAAGNPVAVSVTIHEAPLPSVDLRTVQTAADGAFQACGLTPGEYSVSAAGDKLAARELFAIADSDVHRVHLFLDAAFLRRELVWDGDPPAEPKEETPNPPPRGPLSQLSDAQVRKMLGVPEGSEISVVLWRAVDNSQVRFSRAAPDGESNSLALSAGDYSVGAHVSEGSLCKGDRVRRSARYRWLAPSRTRQ